ncbi:uncharacterized protein LOC116159405 [Photinus pyralis]|uniref:uncharacterized protein LOC116159405 n=1 Tax=Photinus pyralis TaxID=7054 RepID=UPI00126706EE|nr:uncharacterized protein LOC116159405 [Photinus pyralis]
MSYAVVTFLNNDDEETDEYYSSEIPMSWLCENNTKCWWPAQSKNVTSLITREVPPNTDKWDLEEIKVDILGVSLEKARKLADNLDYVSTDDAEKGRGKRKVTQPTKLLSDDDSEPQISSKSWRQFTNIALPPQLPSCSSNNLSQAEGVTPHVNIARNVLLYFRSSPQYYNNLFTM